MSTGALVAGVGMVPFTSPSRGASYEVMAQRATLAALADAGVDYPAVQQAYVGYVYGDSTCGQAALYGLGLTGVPVVNVNNNCATGSSALWLARQAVQSGSADCVLALGFEQMRRGALSAQWDDRLNPLRRFDQVIEDSCGPSPGVPMTLRYFGAAGEAYTERHGTAPETWAKIAVKVRRHAAANPHAAFRDPLTVEQVLAPPRMYGPLTRLQCCPSTCGAAAAVVCGEEFARRHGLDRAVAIRAQAMTTDRGSTFADADLTRLVGAAMSREAADQVYQRAGIGPADLDVIELHDCFTVNELLTYEALGLAPDGEGERLVADSKTTYGGSVVVNPSGGLLAKGHPLGATGLAQCAELVWQLRGEAEGRQVEGARTALQHNIGLGGACVVTLYERVA